MKNIESFKSLEENFSSLWLQYPPFKESKKTRQDVQHATSLSLAENMTYNVI